MIHLAHVVFLRVKLNPEEPLRSVFDTIHKECCGHGYVQMNKEATTIARCIAKSTCIPEPGFEVHVVGTDGENVYDGVIDPSQWIKKDPLKLNDRVIIRNTTDRDLDGKSGTLMGIASQHQDNIFWIVELDEPLTDRRAIVLTDSCLEQVKDSWKLKYR